MGTPAGLFLIAHGLVHLGVWLAPASEDAPFDPRHSWLLGEVPALARLLAVTSCLLLVPAGILLLGHANLAVVFSVAGATVSLLLVLVTFHPWLSFAVAINVAIIVVALSVGPALGLSPVGVR